MTDMNIIETKKVCGLTVKIMTDDDPMNPRDWDHVGNMYCFHRRYKLGDKHNFSMEDVEEIVNDTENNISLPLYLMDHSGLSMSTGDYGDKFDSGQVGYITAPKGTHGLDDEKLIEALKAEVEVYSKFLSGSCYCYTIEDTTGEFVDSCGGYYDMESMEDDYTSSAKYFLKKREDRVDKIIAQQQKKPFKAKKKVIFQVMNESRKYLTSAIINKIAESLDILPVQVEAVYEKVRNKLSDS
jgi:hypothetical protein